MQPALIPLLLHARSMPLPFNRMAPVVALLWVLMAAPLHAGELAEVQRLAGAGELVAALQRADAALAARPRDAELRFIRGVLLADLKRDADAMAVFQQLHEDYPELPDPLNNLAVIHAGQGRLDEARAALESALRNDPRHRHARENLAEIYLRLAIRLWDGLAASGPADPILQRRLRLARELLREPF